MKKQLTLDDTNTVEDVDGRVYHLPRVYSAEELEHVEGQNQDQEEGDPEEEEQAPKEYFPPAEVGHTNNYTSMFSSPI